MVVHECQTWFHFFSFFAFIYQILCYFESSKKIESIQKRCPRLLLLNDSESDSANLLKNTTAIKIKDYAL